MSSTLVPRGSRRSSLALKSSRRQRREELVAHGADDRESGPPKGVPNLAARVRFHAVLHLSATERASNAHDNLRRLSEAKAPSGSSCCYAPRLDVGTGTPHATSLISASTCSSQNRMSISRYSAVAVARCSCACSRVPVRRESLPRPRWQWAIEGAHAELVSQRDRAPVVGLGFLPVGRIAARGYLAEEAKSVDLVAALLVPCERGRARAPRAAPRPLFCPVESHTSPKRNGSEEMIRDQLHRSGLIGHLAQQGNGLCGPIRERVYRSERCCESVEIERGQPELVADLQALLQRQAGQRGRSPWRRRTIPTPMHAVIRPSGFSIASARRSDSSVRRVASANSPSSASDHAR